MLLLEYLRAQLLLNFGYELTDCPPEIYGAPVADDESAQLQVAHAAAPNDEQRAVESAPLHAAYQQQLVQQLTEPFQEHQRYMLSRTPTAEQMLYSAELARSQIEADAAAASGAAAQAAVVSPSAAAAPPTVSVDLERLSRTELEYLLEQFQPDKHVAPST